MFNRVYLIYFPFSAAYRLPTDRLLGRLLGYLLGYLLLVATYLAACLLLVLRAAVQANAAVA